MVIGETITLHRTPSGATAAAAEVVIPRQLGAVRIVREIGRGGMGVVFLGRDELLGRDVAVKFLLHATAGSDDPGFTRFLDGARAAAAVRHAGLTDVHQADLVQGVPYLVMEYIDGPTLREVLDRAGPLPASTVVTAAAAVADAIAALHEHGVVHRDIKASNVLIDADGRVLVTDFGLACPRYARRDDPSFGWLAGTPGYMAPEMFDGALSPRSDVYALGILTFELLCGALPFQGSADDLRELHAHQPLPQEPLQRADVDAALVEILERATRKNPMFRYKSAREFQRALQATAVPFAGLAALSDLVTHCRSRAAGPGAGSLEPPTPATYAELLATKAARKRREKTTRAEWVLEPHPAIAPPAADDPSPAGRPAERAAADSISAPSSDADAARGSPAHTDAGRAAAGAVHTIGVDVACVQCAYDLRGLTLTAHCPECATPVSKSTQPDRLIFADPRWVARLALGQTLLCAATLGATLIFATLPIFLFTRVAKQSILRSSGTAIGVAIDYAAPAIAVATLLVLMAGAFLATTAEPRGGARRGPLSRRVARAGLFGMGVLLVLMLAGKKLPHALRVLQPLLEVIRAVWWLPGAAALVTLLIFWNGLLRRIPNPKLARDARSAPAVIAALICARAAYSIIWSPRLIATEPPLGAQFLLSTVPTIGLMLTVPWLGVLTFRSRRAVRRVQGHCVPYAGVVGQAMAGTS